MRATISEIGPTLLARILELNDTQEGVLEIVFKLADDRGLLLLDMDDLRALLSFVAENQKEISTHYGLVSTQSIAAIQRGLVGLDSDGGNNFFGEPALELADLMRTDLSGRGIVNILAADQLVLKPRLYSSFLLWLLSELFENLPEVGDLDKPKLVFFFDEAHLLFNDAPPALRQRVEQVVRLIRSKGVGVYFCSQFPDDIPSGNSGSVGQPRSARLAGLHAARSKGGEDGGGNFRVESEAGRGPGDFATGRGRSVGFDAARAGDSDAGGAHDDLPAALPDGSDYRRRTSRRVERAARSADEVRYAGEPRIGLRNVDANAKPATTAAAARKVQVAAQGGTRTATARWQSGGRTALGVRCDAQRHAVGQQVAAKEWSKRWPNRPPARSAVRSDGKFCAACWGAFSADRSGKAR